MKIKTYYDPKPISNRNFDWVAIDEETYDSAPDSCRRHGYGATEQQAVDDLLRLQQLPRYGELA